jgi:hypothetical protein
VFEITLFYGTVQRHKVGTYILHQLFVMSKFDQDPDPDTHWFGYLDSDPHGGKNLDPDPH